MGTRSHRVLRPGDRVRLELPHSEVCMHMRVAGRVMDVELTDGEHTMAQLLNPDGSAFSLPITTGEAGIYGSPRDGYYCYPEGGGDDPADPLHEERADLFEEQPGDPGWDLTNHGADEC
jgi:hypothetical protein